MKKLFFLLLLGIAFLTSCTVIKMADNKDQTSQFSVTYSNPQVKVMTIYNSSRNIIFRDTIISTPVCINKMEIPNTPESVVSYLIYWKKGEAFPRSIQFMMGEEVVLENQCLFQLETEN